MIFANAVSLSTKGLKLTFKKLLTVKIVNSHKATNFK